MPENSNNVDFELARMLSARCAEKAARRFYEFLGHGVTDISLGQLSRDSDEWKQYDLLVGGEKPVDVKNARPPLHCRDRYMQHIVRRLKHARRKDVTIVAVLSPYLKLDRIDNAVFGSDLGQITILGETDRAAITQLQERFSEAGRVAVKVETYVEHHYVIPPWAFEYPPEFYNSRNLGRGELRECGYSGMAPLNEFRRFCTNPLPAFLFAGLPLPSHWDKELSPWEVDFYRSLLPLNEETVSMPVLFLTLLTHFIKMASKESDVAGYHPAKYRLFLFSENDQQCNRPLGLHDPLDIIRNLLSTLEVLWSHRDAIRFHEFGRFDFQGLGMLRGTRRGTRRTETILAYCGGLVSGKGKCGYSPLIIGQNPTCEVCNKLICPKCGYCLYFPGNPYI
jgi:hypothetical protein